MIDSAGSFDAFKNLVIAISDLVNAYAIVNGKVASPSIPAATTSQVTSGQGRVARVSVTTAGSTAGSIYDSTSATPAATSLLAAIPNTVGVFDINIPYVYGIVVTTGTGQVATVVYS